MKKAWDSHGTDWIEVVIPPATEDDEQYKIRVNLTFMLSNWECIFGRGCPGLFKIESSQINPDVGCCTGSFWFHDRPDYERVKARIADLTPEDWDDELRSYVEKHGWANIYKDNFDADPDEDEFNGKGKVFEGACVFANRSTGSVGSTGKIGCAFHHMGERTGAPDHVDIMPTVCWQLPLRLQYNDQNSDVVLTAWDAGQWAGTEDDYDEWEDMRYHCHWWCIDSPEAYIGESMVWKTMEREIRASVGDREYDLINDAIMARMQNVYRNMPGATVNDGRPLLPLLVGNREPRRPEPVFEKKMEEYRALQT